MVATSAGTKKLNPVNMSAISGRRPINFFMVKMWKPTVRGPCRISGTTPLRTQ